jgi:hypothetical protein
MIRRSTDGAIAVSVLSHVLSKTDFPTMATLFRATVMLSVLVGLPGAWIYYGPLPTGAQRVVDRFVAIAKETTGWKEAEAKPAPTWDFTKSAPIVAEGLGENSGGMNLPARYVDAPPLQFGSALPLPEPTPATVPSTLAERVEPLLTQLRQFGVAEYALERWGGDGKLYRFHCEMPIGGGSLTQQFEAVAANPEASVEQVVAEVSQWRLARQAGGM